MEALGQEILLVVVADGRNHLPGCQQLSGSLHGHTAQHSTTQQGTARTAGHGTKHLSWPGDHASMPIASWLAGCQRLRGGWHLFWPVIQGLWWLAVLCTKETSPPVSPSAHLPADLCECHPARVAECSQLAHLKLRQQQQHLEQRLGGRRQQRGQPSCRRN